MLTPDREKMIAVGAVALLLLTCAGGVALSLNLRADAAAELEARRTALSELDRRVHAKAGAAEKAIAAVAPAGAFVSAATPGLAGAEVQAYLSAMASDHQALLVSSGITLAKREDAADSIRVEATLEITQSALPALLFQVESGQPYLFVESLSLQPSGNGVAHGDDDPRLRVTLGLRALWRRVAA